MVLPDYCREFTITVLEEVTNLIFVTGYDCRIGVN